MGAGAGTLHRSDSLTIFLLWYSLRGGMAGGESLYDLWKLAQEEGSAELISDFLALSARLEHLRGIQEWLDEPW